MTGHTHHHGEHAGHGDHGVSMVRDLLQRFIVSVVLGLPVVLLSPLGTTLAGHPLTPPLGLASGPVSLVLTSFVVWWGAWPFLSAAARSLRQGELTMMTLIATGVLVSYLYSVAVSLGLPGEPFYDAAVMLTAFSLLGHWLEMRSRVATGRAVEALLRLTPPTARRVRDGIEEEVPLESMVVGDQSCRAARRHGPGGRRRHRRFELRGRVHAHRGADPGPKGDRRVGHRRDAERSGRVSLPGHARRAATRRSPRSWRWCGTRSRPRRPAQRLADLAGDIS